MDRALYTAMSGASATLKAQAAVSHNIANATTTGFRAELVALQAFEVKGEGFASRVSATLGKSGFDATPGVVMHTGNELDVAVRGNAWLAVQDSNGKPAFTREGALQVDSLGQLQTLSGNKVVGEGGPIVLPPHSKMSIAEDGTVSIVPLGQSAETVAVIGRIRVVEANAKQMARGEDGLFRLNNGGTGTPVAGSALQVGALESSNVNLPSTMIEMIELARQFEMQVKMIKTTEENSRAASSLLRVS